jgi:LysM repeat protein
MRTIILVLSMLLCASSCTRKNLLNSTDPAVEEYNPRLSEQYKIYEVLATDNIASVAKKTDVSANIIIRYNYLKKPYLLKTGEMLKIPNIQSQEEDLIDAVDSLEDIDKTSSRHIQISPRK